MIRRQLERARYRVRLAHSGEEAIAQALKHRPDLISMDIQMPGMNGVKAIEILRANPQTTDIPIVVVSVVQDEEQLSKLGVADILDKPIDEDSFCRWSSGSLWEGQRILDLCFRTLKRGSSLEEVLSHRGYQLIFAQDGLDSAGSCSQRAAGSHPDGSATARYGWL